MGKKVTRGDSKYSEAERRGENHMELFARLAKITNCHGRPGDRKPKRKG